LHEPDVDALSHDALEEIAEDRRITKAAVPIFGKRRMIWNRLVEDQTRKPSVGKVQTDLVKQPPLTRDSVEIADQQDAQQNLGIDRRPANLTVEWRQLFANRSKVDVSVDRAQQVIR